MILKINLPAFAFAPLARPPFRALPMAIPGPDSKIFGLGDN
jgi:hypothetical protein